jgi:hypothetical protein
VRSPRTRRGAHRKNEARVKGRKQYQRTRLYEELADNKQTASLAIACPECDVPPFALCVGRQFRPIAIHAERIKATPAPET